MAARSELLGRAAIFYWGIRAYNISCPEILGLTSGELLALICINVSKNRWLGNLFVLLLSFSEADRHYFFFFAYCV